jgi:tRNA A37 threonylcarbamoyladenosine synthetase subunit TsaC/SUA5/YrdC
MYQLLQFIYATKVQIIATSLNISDIASPATLLYNVIYRFGSNSESSVKMEDLEK